MTDEKRMFRVEWGTRSDAIFAEVAEALAVPTDLIMATQAIDRGTILALFTPDLDQGDDTVWSAVLKRDGDGVLHAGRLEPNPEMTEHLRSMGRDS